MIILVILAVLLAAVFAAAVTADKNVKVQNQMLDELFRGLRAEYPVTQEDAGSFSTIRIRRIMNFRVRRYRMEGVGNIAVMQVNAGLMQMSTVMLTPFLKDVPLVSFDNIYMLRRRKAYIEFIDPEQEERGQENMYRRQLLLLETEFADLKPVSLSHSWQDPLNVFLLLRQADASADPRLAEMQDAAVRKLLSICDDAPALDAAGTEEKVRSTERYYRNLISRGGAATDVFKSTLGEEQTEKFFDEVFFGTAAYRG